MIPGDGERPVRGALNFLDNAVDRSTGTIQLKATFPNKDRSLWPGQFVNVVLILTSQPDALVLPSQAVQRGQEGSYVFVVKPDLTVEYRPVVVGAILDNDTVIEKGVNPGERVVTDGQLRLGPGAQVRIVEGVEGKGQGFPTMNISELFIRRPVMATLVMMGIVLFGIMGYRLLPVSELPNVDFPTIQVIGESPRRQPGNHGLLCGDPAGEASFPPSPAWIP